MRDREIESLVMSEIYKQLTDIYLSRIDLQQIAEAPLHVNWSVSLPLNTSFYFRRSNKSYCYRPSVEIDISFIHDTIDINVADGLSFTDLSKPPVFSMHLSEPDCIQYVVEMAVHHLLALGSS